MARLLNRPNMTKEKLEILLSRQSQLPREKKKHEFAIDSENVFEQMKEDVMKVIKLIKMKL